MHKKILPLIVVLIGCALNLHAQLERAGVQVLKNGGKALSNGAVGQAGLRGAAGQAALRGAVTVRVTDAVIKNATINPRDVNAAVTTPALTRSGAAVTPGANPLSVNSSLPKVGEINLGRNVLTAETRASLENIRKAASQQSLLSAETSALLEKTAVESAAPKSTTHITAAKNLIDKTIQESSLLPEVKADYLRFFNKMFEGKDKTGINPEDDFTKDFFNDPASTLDIAMLHDIKNIVQELPLSEGLFARMIVRDGVLMPEVEVSKSITFEEAQEVFKDALAGAPYTGEHITKGLEGKQVRFGKHEMRGSSDPNSVPVLHVHVEQLAPTDMFVGKSSRMAGKTIWLNISYKIPVSEETIHTMAEKYPFTLLEGMSPEARLEWLSELAKNNSVSGSDIGPLVKHLKRYYEAVVGAERDFQGVVLHTDEELPAGLQKYRFQREDALEQLYLKLYGKPFPTDSEYNVLFPVELEEQVLRESSNRVVRSLGSAFHNAKVGFKADMYNKLVENAKTRFTAMSQEDGINAIKDALLHAGL